MPTNEINTLLSGGPPALTKAGAYAFILGVLLAVLASILPPLNSMFGIPMFLSQAGVTVSLVTLGVVVGLLNIKAKETKDFLLVVTVLVLVTYAGSSGNLTLIPYAVGTVIASFFGNIMNFAIPAAIVVGLKEIYKLTSAN